MTDNVTSLGATRATAAGDNRLWTPIECLEEAIRGLRSGEVKANKIVVLFVEQGEQEFDVSHHSANIKASEILAALECLKIKVFNHMGFI